MTHPWFAAGTRPRILAHRGFVPSDSEGVLENSFASFAAAHAAGFTYVESDCHLTSDGEVVLFHDDDLQRTSGDPRMIADVTGQELGNIMADKGGMITLTQALESFPTLRFNIDVKSDAVARPAGLAIAKHSRRVLLTSFSEPRRQAALASARAHQGDPATSPGARLLAKIVAAATLRSDTALTKLFRGLDAVQVPVRYGRLTVITPRLIAAAHRHNVEVHAWTINDVTEMERLLDLGVDGLITDQPLVARNLITRRGI